MPEVTTETPPVNVPGITLQDITVMITIIDAGSQRGAWKGEELAAVGNLRNKLSTIVDVLNTAQVEANNANNASNDADDSSEDGGE